ncbi:MAG: PH domain-containing protein [Gemmatimonadales bacterium]
MSYIDRHLLPGEAVMYRTRLHWKIFVMPVLVSLILVALALWALSANRRLLAIPPIVVALLLLFAAWLRRNSSEFAVTNRRVIIKLGVMTTRSMELLLPKVEGITVTQSVAGRMFGFGEIVVTGSGGTQEPFDSIQSPLDFRQAVQAATDGGGDRR